MRALGVRVYREVPWVRIPPSPLRTTLFEGGFLISQGIIRFKPILTAKTTYECGWFFHIRKVLPGSNPHNLRERFAAISARKKLPDNWVVFSIRKVLKGSIPHSLRECFPAISANILTAQY